MPDGHNKRICLTVFAHADDETLLAGALIPKLVKDGWTVHLLCLAPGDDDRAGRLELAAADLGVASVTSLRFMAAPEAGRGDRHKGAPLLTSAPEAAVVERIAGKLAEITPQMIVTHSAEGDYGHPDHVICHRATVKAASTAVPGTMVYSLAWPGPLVWLVVKGPRLIRSFGRRRNESIGSAEFVAQDVRQGNGVIETHRYRVGQFLSIRKKASQHYAKEIALGPLPFRLLEASPTWFQRPFLGVARLRRVR